VAQRVKSLITQVFTCAMGGGANGAKGLNFTVKSLIIKGPDLRHPPWLKLFIMAKSLIIKDFILIIKDFICATPLGTYNYNEINYLRFVCAICATPFGVYNYIKINYLSHLRHKKGGPKFVF